MGPERIELSAKERERLRVLQQVEEGHLKQIEAARRLHLTDRQVRRLQVRLRSQGDRGIVHRLRGRGSNRKIPESAEPYLGPLGRARFHRRELAHLTGLAGTPRTTAGAVHG